VAGPGFDLPASLDYIVPARAAAVRNLEFDYDLLVRPMEGRMMRTVWRIVRHREAAEDALQDALAVIWKKRDAVARHPKPEALILRIAVTAAYDALRKSRRRLRHETAGMAGERADADAPPVTKALEDRDLRAAILGAIACLPRRQATAVILHIVEEQSYEEVARAMGCSASTARVHVLRGRAGLVRMLAGEHPGFAGAADRGGKESTS
jgi:RNA polymerase sigma factor (sigma-70 family)